jgi:hypothetical protein
MGIKKYVNLTFLLKMIAQEKDSGFGWKFEDFEFRAAFHRL